MKFESIDQPTLRIAGPTISTSHADAQTDIGAFWASVDMPTLFAHAKSEELFGAYYNLDQKTGKYEMMIGVVVDSASELPEGWQAVMIEDNNYVVTQLPNAEPPAVVKTWQYIWSDWTEKSNRAFGVDFERYVETENGREAQIRISMR